MPQVARVERQQVSCCTIGPVRVLHNQHQRLLLGKCLEHHEDLLKQANTGELRMGRWASWPS